MFLVPLLALLWLSPSGAPAEWTVIPEKSILAVITHKAGIAKGLAHNHFIFAGNYTLSLSMDAGPDTLKLTAELPVDELIVDETETSKRYYGRIEELGILSEPFEPLKDKDRNKIRKAMLGKKQLHGAEHKQIAARLVGVRSEKTTIGKQSFTHVLTMTFTIRGKTAEVEVPAVIETTDGVLKLEATAPMKFSDFGIKPYSAMLGAVANEDRLDLYVYLEAR
ncbi:MAG: YceI family protein [Acidobacteriota bacterium]|nr:YceI family protein [Acidobacteriota bacterium]